MFLPPLLAEALLPRTPQHREFLHWVGIIGLFVGLTLALAVALSTCDDCTPFTSPPPAVPALVSVELGGHP